MVTVLVLVMSNHDLGLGFGLVTHGLAGSSVTLFYGTCLPRVNTTHRAANVSFKASYLLLLFLLLFLSIRSDPDLWKCISSALVSSSSLEVDHRLR